MCSLGYCHALLLSTAGVDGLEMFFYYYQRSTCFGRFSAHHQELIKLYVQPWVLSCSPAVYCWCGWVGTNHPHLPSPLGKNRLRETYRCFDSEAFRTFCETRKQEFCLWILLWTIRFSTNLPHKIRSQKLSLQLRFFY